MEITKLSRFALLLLLSASLISCEKEGERSKPLIGVPEGIVAEGATWDVVTSGFPYSDSPATDAEGNIYYSDVVSSLIIRLSPDQQIETFATDTAQTQGLVIGADGYLYGCRNSDAQIVRYSPDGSLEILAQGKGTVRKDASAAQVTLLSLDEYCNDLAVNVAGGVWFTDRENQQILYLSPDGDIRKVAGGFRGNGIQLSLDKNMLVVTDSNDPKMHAFRIGENGSLDELPDYFEPIKVFLRKGQKLSDVKPGTNGMTIDSEGRFYVATFLGVQILDKTGKHVGVIPGPKGYMSNVGFGGPDRKWLYATGSNLSRLRMDVPGAPN